ncbi:peroxidase family protein [Mesorhizobium sp. LHD-90]|uniref:peroxidase family protein n=1 Tax=Mesorhizobium sp. LHD-90 TaxID=3071414 RepID=UPI0027DECACA|nr:peroxidase family protein [Mesorhizobium sp. LHD-90]MDQ6434249.1 peroxidase family protein [Mesorhizobium sp. LHD-90]
MRHGDDADYETLVNHRRTYSTKRMSARPAVESARSSSGEVLRQRLLFPSLAGRPISLISSDDDSVAVERTQEAISAISSRMLGPIDPSDVSDIPSAFTYFGQFVFHDMVFSRIFGAPAREVGERPMRNASSGSIDLSGLYGRGPVVDPHLYDWASATDPTLCRFPLGLPAVSDRTVNLPVDGTVERARDLPRIDGAGGYMSVCGRKAPYRPLVADPRNDDNLILSQLHCTLMQVHNRLIDVQMKRQAVSPKDAFERARAYLTSAYRRVVVDDYLRRILFGPVWEHFFKGEDFHGPGLASLEPLADLPLEFSFGASRFAHAMVRDRYRVNQTFDGDPSSLREVLSFSSQRPNGDVPIRANWAVDWHRFAELGGAGDLVKARRISPFLTYELAVVKHAADLDGTPRSIAFMDCWRCYHLGLPSGQRVAAAVAAALPRECGEVKVLTGSDMLPTQKCRQRHSFHAAELERALQAHPQFLEETPLSYYVLQEASLLGDDGNHLGPVGSYVIAATVAAALFNASDSEIHVQLPWAVKPRTLAGLLSLADERLVPDETLNGYLERTVRPDLSARGHRRTGNAT